MSYIDAEKLIAEIERRIRVIKPQKGQGIILCEQLTKQLQDLLSFIKSLQQEQPLTIEKVVGQCKKFGGNPEVIQPEVDVNKWAVTAAFLKCEKCGKIVSEMYGEKFNNIPRNRDKYLAFLRQVGLDGRFSELAGILQRYGAMPKPKEQPEANSEKEEYVGVAESPLKTFQRVNEFEEGASYRH